MFVELEEVAPNIGQAEAAGFREGWSWHSLNQARD